MKKGDSFLDHSVVDVNSVLRGRWKVSCLHYCSCCELFSDTRDSSTEGKRNEEFCWTCFTNIETYYTTGWDCTRLFVPCRFWSIV